MKDFKQVQRITIAPMAIFTRKDLAANNADEFAALAAKSAKEGKPHSYASVGNGSFYHFLGEQMSKLIGVPMTHVPYKGAAYLQRDLLGGRSTSSFHRMARSMQNLRRQEKSSSLPHY
jgi:tripartite-type tricarboxylate transporter receptor subunit TctC